MSTFVRCRVSVRNEFFSSYLFKQVLKISDNFCTATLVVADPGFPRRFGGGGGGRQLLGGGENILFGNVFCRKLHESERNWTEKGALVRRTPRSPRPLDLSMRLAAGH